MPQQGLSEEFHEQNKAEHLVKMLSNKDISAHDLAYVAYMIKNDPSILTSPDFVGHFKMPDMAVAYQAKTDIKQIIAQSAQSQEALKVVLDNLSKVDLPMHGKTTTIEGKPRTAANYFLDNARLQNGEIIGTQMVKNMHFMGNMDFSTPENQALKSTVHEHLEQTASFYPKLYTSYGANHNARNSLGQKVDQLMDAYIEENKAKRASTVVENKPQRQSTLAEARDAVYQGNATAEQKKMVEDDTNEAELSNIDDPRNKYSGYNHKGDKFKDEDIIKYMYEEWFLALMSWGFDKIEEGVEIAVDYTLDGLRSLSERQKKDAAETKNRDLKPIKTKVASFGEETDELIKNFKDAAPLYAQNFMDLKKDTRYGITSQNEAALRQKYGNNLINAFKADPSKLEQLRNIPDEGIKNIVDHIKVVGECALALSRMEMVDEVMRSDSKWRDSLSGEYLTNDELIAGDKGFIERVGKRQERIMLAVRTISEDAQDFAKEGLGAKQTDAQKKAWVKKNILDEYDALAKSKDVSPQRRAQLAEQRAKFEKQYTAGMTDGQVAQAYTSLKVNTYIDGVAQACQQAMQKQTEFDKDGRYDAVKKAPSKDVKNIIDEADKVTEQAIDRGIGYTKIFGRRQSTTPSKRTLEEEAMSYMTDFPLEEMLNTNTTSTTGQAENKVSLAERKRHVEEIKAHRIEQTNKKVNAQYAPMIHGGRM